MIVKYLTARRRQTGFFSININSKCLKHLDDSNIFNRKVAPQQDLYH